MSKPKVFVSRQIAQEAIYMLKQSAEVEVWTGDVPIARELLLEKVKDIDGLLSMLTERVDGALMDAAPRLKAVSNFAVGYDNIDVVEATKWGIVVGNTPGVLTDTTADLAFALLMSAARRVVEGDSYVRSGKWLTWGPMILLGQDIHHATLGIIGLGRIGAEVAKRARGFSMKVIYYDTVRRTVEEEKQLGVEYVADLTKLYSTADFISPHVALTPETYHLIGEEEFALMKPTAILINTSRGQVVNPQALYEALKSRRIFAAAIDVTEPEPIPADDPLLTLDNLIITPHIASGSVATRTRMATLAVENLLAGLVGKMPPHCLNPEVLKQ